VPDVRDFEPSDYKFIVSPGGPFSAGVAALPSYALSYRRAFDHR